MNQVYIAEGPKPSTRNKCRPKSPALRSYAEVAAIVTARHGLLFSEARIKTICIAAETKLAHAFMADPLLREQLLGGGSRDFDAASGAGRCPKAQQVASSLGGRRSLARQHAGDQS
ncbi:MAG: hypothetical protein KJZ69_10715 [Phycisphaerales bacterium]|nr:hypothetical protein [Phycisphaerales bacterium]